MAPEIAEGHMRISEILEPKAILADLPGGAAEEALTCICRPLAERTRLDAQRLVDALLARERLGSTAIGEGVAIPHAKLHGIHHLVGGLGRSRSGIDLNPPDARPVRLLFGLFAPEHGQSRYLDALARISRLLKSAAVRESLLIAKGPDDIRRIIKAEEAR
jgi:nitrogen PTS system EIIA component